MSDRSSGVSLPAAGYLLAVASAAANMTAPLYPAYREAFDLSPALVTAVYAGYAVVTIPALLVFGPASDAYGRRPVLAVAAAATAAGAGLLGSATGLGVLLAGRAVLGLALGAAIGAAPAAIVEAEPSGDRGRASLLVAPAFVVGTATGPVATGVLADYGPAPLRLPYLVLLALLAPGAAGVAAMGHSRRRTRRWRPTRPGVPPGIRVGFAIAATAGALAWAVAALFLALVPSFLTAATGAADLTATGGIVTAMLAVSAAVQLTGRRLPTRTAQAAGLAALAAGLGGLVAAGVTESLAVMLAATALAGSGHGLAFLGAMTKITALAPPRRRGEVTASAYVVIYTAVAAPTVGAGLVATRTGLVPAVSLFATLLAVACLATLAAIAARAHHRQHSAHVCTTGRGRRQSATPQLLRGRTTYDDSVCGESTRDDPRCPRTRAAGVLQSVDR